MKSISKKAISTIQKRFIEEAPNISTIEVPAISPKELKKTGIDTTDKTIEIKNLILKKDILFTDNYSIRLIDESKDLNGTPLSDHPELLAKLMKIWKQDENKISFTELLKLNIYTPLTNFIVGNFELNASTFGKHFTITIADDEKNEESKWIDDAVSLKRVLKILGEYKLTAHKLRNYKELDLNSDLQTFFKHSFVSVHKSSGHHKELFDLVIGDIDNNAVVIELKMAKSAQSAGESDRACHQMERYAAQIPDTDFVMVIVGPDNLEEHNNIQKIYKKSKKLENVFYYYLKPNL